MYWYDYDPPSQGFCPLRILSDGESLTGIQFMPESPDPLTDDICEPVSVIRDTIRWLDLYFQGQIPDFRPKYTLQEGTAFQKLVWQRLIEIPYGTTVTYGELAKEIASETGAAHMSAQAVGGAVGRNPIPIILPCHRVMGASGHVTGFGGGIPLKLNLLRLEGIDTTHFILPKGARA